MRATLIALGILLAGAALAPANPYCYGGPQVPDACGPGYFVTNCYGMVYGPNYWLRPPFPPVGAVPPNLGGGGNSPQFPTHPYARSPRDYFMVYDNWWDISQYRFLP